MSYTPVPTDSSLPPITVNLLSDTQTRPTPAMREAMARAECGDEQIGDDPTVNLLCERVADLLGKEAAIFMPSGTMCNVAATLAHCQRGDEILAHKTAHIISREGGAHAALGGFQVTQLNGIDGQFSAKTFRAALHPRTRYEPAQTLVSVEQTANIGGGTIWAKDALEEISAVAKDHGLVTHMDGARLMNACVAADIEAHDMAAGWDSVWIDFTKGLGAPLGAAMAGSRDFIDEVWRWKQRLGGSMRQAGLSAAGCLYSLDHHVDRLADDHANASALARGPRPDRRRHRAAAADKSGVLHAGSGRRQRCRHGESLARKGRAAGDDGRPHPRLHAYRRDGRDDRRRAGNGAGDRAGSVMVCTTYLRHCEPTHSRLLTTKR